MKRLPSPRLSIGGAACTCIGRKEGGWGGTGGRDDDANAAVAGGGSGGGGGGGCGFGPGGRRGLGASSASFISRRLLGLAREGGEPAVGWAAAAAGGADASGDASALFFRSCEAGRSRGCLLEGRKLIGDGPLALLSSLSASRLLFGDSSSPLSFLRFLSALALPFFLSPRRPRDPSSRSLLLAPSADVSPSERRPNDSCTPCTLRSRVPKKASIDRRSALSPSSTFLSLLSAALAAAAAGAGAGARSSHLPLQYRPG
mmetsp:Transcript_15053/g.43177  ORF Transcript_15053/g.43177 Transcript_15053/m.43177 type:complete len:258 (+) Transcript_15053:413-1186(+)